ncbi:hypothetical protein [Niabella terrae]
MELNELKSIWATVNTPTISAFEIQNMLSENKHPVLKSLKKQFIIEILGWLIFIAFYYSMLDGDKKPFWVNILLVCSILLPLVHNLLGYRLSKNLVYGSSIYESLKNYQAKFKTYAFVSIISRQVYLIGLLLFLTSGIHWEYGKFLSVIFIVSFFLLQLFVMLMIWRKRLKSLERTIATFH